MTTNENNSRGRFHLLERVSASVPGLERLEGEIHQALAALGLADEKLRERRIAVAVGSRGIANIREIARASCGWLKSRGAQPFVFPAMGSHGGATGEGQRQILADYGVTPDFVGAEICSSMATVSLGKTSQGFEVFMDRNAWSADSVLVINRVKPHTDFSGKIESGLLKMMAVGMGKIDGASQVHRWGWQCGHEQVIRAMSARVLASGKILCGLAVIENELHQICAVRAARPEGIVAQEEAALQMARPLVPRIPFPKFHLLIVNEMGKNISGAGMDTKVIGRGVELPPGAAPEIRLIYVRDLTPESEGNAVGIGLADLIHERLYRKVDLQKTYINARTAMSPLAARLPIYLPSDQEALDLALGNLGSPATEEQRIVWVRNTLNLERLAVSECLARDGPPAGGWRLAAQGTPAQFDSNGNLSPAL